MRRLIPVLLVALTVACGPPPLEEGIVIERIFEPEHDERYTEMVPYTEVYTETVCSSRYNIDGSYAGQDCHPETNTRTSYRSETRCCRLVPDRWFVVVEEENPDDDDPRRSRVGVNQDVYDSCREGQRWREETGCALR